MTQEQFLFQIAERLKAAGIEFMVAGSHSSGFHSHPRATNDVDLVIDPSPAQLDQFLGLTGLTLGRGYFPSAASTNRTHARSSATSSGLPYAGTTT